MKSKRTKLSTPSPALDRACAAAIANRPPADAVVVAGDTAVFNHAALLRGRTLARKDLPAAKRLEIALALARAEGAQQPTAAMLQALR